MALLSLYHFELGFPPGFVPPQGRFLLRYTRHAKAEARRDRYADLSYQLPSHVDTRKSQLVEVEVDKNGKARKLLYRMRGSWGLDLVLAVFTDSYPWRVGTIWANKSDDKHQTLRKSRYAVGSAPRPRRSSDGEA